MNSKEFTDTMQMELAIHDIRRYQQAYKKANNVNGIMVKWKKGWFAVYQPRTGISYHRPLEFRNMTDVLEKRCG